MEVSITTLGSGFSDMGLVFGKAEKNPVRVVEWVEGIFPMLGEYGFQGINHCDVLVLPLVFWEGEFLVDQCFEFI